MSAQGCRRPVSGADQDTRCHWEFFPPRRECRVFNYKFASGIQMLCSEPGPLVTPSLCPQRSRDAWSQPLPSKPPASVSIFGLLTRFHLQKGFHSFKKRLWRPHIKRCSLVSSGQTSKSRLRLLTLEKWFCLKSGHTPEAPGPARAAGSPHLLSRGAQPGPSTPTRPGHSLVNLESTAASKTSIAFTWNATF